MGKILKNNFWLILLISISFIPLFDLFRPGLPLTHDGQDHVARIANFYQGLTEGNLVPRWAGNLNWGYGYPVLMFLYPFPSYLASFFHFLGFNFVVSTKIVFGLGYILSGFFMYLWVKEFFGKEAGFLAGIAYMFAPYRFVDLYVRGALGEHVAFVSPPLILYFLGKLSKNYSPWYIMGGSLGIAALILSHNALSLMFLPIILGYMVSLIYISKKKIASLLHCFIASLLFGFSLSAFFWFPAFFEGKYTLRDIVTKGNITGFESFSRLVWSTWSYGGTGSFSVQVGIIQWLGIILAPFLIWLLWRKKEKSWIFLSFLFLSFWLTIFFIMPLSREIYLATPFLKNFQFAWRFLSLAIFPPAVFLAALIAFLPAKFRLFAILGLLILIFFLNKNYWQAQDFLQKPESFYTGVYPGTTDTGESSPRWSVRFMEKEPKAHLEVIDGDLKIEEGARNSTKHNYSLEATKRSRLRENTLYFPGWEVLVDGQKVNIEFQDPVNRGLITFYAQEGKHNISVVFGETKLRRFADSLSLSSALLLGGISILSFVKRRKI